MYYPSSENKGADQLRGYREADLRLCFRLCRLLVFPWGGSYFKLFKKSFVTAPAGVQNLLLRRKQIYDRDRHTCTVRVCFIRHMSYVMGKTTHYICENKGTDQLQTAKLISAFVFASQIIQFLFFHIFHNLKFPASRLLPMYSSVCVS